MKTKFSILLLFCFIGFLAQGQSLSEFKPKDTSYGLNKLKGKADRIYIAAFNVNYQVYNEKQDFKQGGYQLGGGYKGDAKAEASIGLDGLSDADVQKITDQLYADYLALIKAKGLTIISTDEAAKTETYADYTKIQGGIVSLAQFPGLMATAPTGYEYFVKRIDKSGKAKSGGFLGNPSFVYTKLSSDLNDAVVAEVNMYVMFVSDKNAFRGNGANIKITTDLRLAGTEAIVMTSDSKIKMKGQNTVTMVSSGINFYHGKKGMGATTLYQGTLDKPIFIEGVIEDTKVQSYANRSADYVGVKTLYYTYYSPKNTSSKTAKVVGVEPGLYDKGVYAAAKKFMEHHTQGFLNNL